MCIDGVASDADAFGADIPAGHSLHFARKGSGSATNTVRVQSTKARKASGSVNQYSKGTRYANIEYIGLLNVQGLGIMGVG